MCGVAVGKDTTARSALLYDYYVSRNVRTRYTRERDLFNFVLYKKSDADGRPRRYIIIIFRYYGGSCCPRA